MDISGLVVSDTPAAIEQSAALFFDTRTLFEKWLQSLGAIHRFANETFQSDCEEKAFAATHCEVIFDGVLQVDSLVKGSIRSAFGTLVMTEKGRIEADVDVRIAIIAGCLTGNLRATEYVVLESGARVSGDIHTPSLEVRDGAVFEGTSFFIERGVYPRSRHMETETEALQAAAIGA